jgi:hypothetical protein
VQLEHAFALTCLQRFGVQRAADICKDDKLADRSDAIATLIEDELEAATAAGGVAVGPLALLRDEREVQARPAKLLWLFEPYLQDLYERRQWKQIEAFENASVGARLIAALVLATARTGELVPSAEQADLVRFHTARRQWLVSYMLGRSCDPECRGKLVDVMVSTYGEAQGDYDEALRKLVTLPRGESGPAVAQLHARLLWCQVDTDDLSEFRDRVVVPAVTEALAKPDLDRAVLDDLVGLAALVPEPAPPVAGDTDPNRVRLATERAAAWKSLNAAIEKAGDRLVRPFGARRAAVKRERVNPPPMIKRVSFCGAQDLTDRTVGNIDK